MSSYRPPRPQVTTVGKKPELKYPEERFLNRQVHGICLNGMELKGKLLMVDKYVLLLGFDDGTDGLVYKHGLCMFGEIPTH